MRLATLAMVAALAAGAPTKKGSTAIKAEDCHPLISVDDVCDSHKVPDCPWNSGLFNDTYMEQPINIFGRHSACEGCKNLSRWQYYRNPKSGSTALEKFLMECKDVAYHNHGDGCKDQSVCDARSPRWDNTKTFVVLRDPRERLPSQCAPSPGRQTAAGCTRTP